MAFPTKVHAMNRQASQQWYINFPSALAQAMEFSPRNRRVDRRNQVPSRPPPAPCLPLPF